MSVNHKVVLKIGWIAILGCAVLWVLVVGCAFFLGGMDAAEYWGTLLATGLLIMMPAVIPFFLYSAVVAFRRAFVTSGGRRIVWALFFASAFGLFCYFVWAIAQIQWG